jgi:hypothetical protein
MTNIVRNGFTAGNNTGILKPAIIDSCSFLEEVGKALVMNGSGFSVGRE